MLPNCLLGEKKEDEQLGVASGNRAGILLLELVIYAKLNRIAILKKTKLHSFGSAGSISLVLFLSTPN